MIKKNSNPMLAHQKKNGQIEDQNSSQVRKQPKTNQNTKTYYVMQL